MANVKFSNTKDLKGKKAELTDKIAADCGPKAAGKFRDGLDKTIDAWNKMIVETIKKCDDLKGVPFNSAHAKKIYADYAKGIEINVKYDKSGVTLSIKQSKTFKGGALAESITYKS